MERLHVRYSSRASNKQLVGGMFLLHKSKNFLTEDKLKELSIFGNIFIISKLTKIELNGKSKEFKLSIMSNIWFVSLILDGSSLAMS